MAGSGPNNVWAVAGRGALLRWDGHAWSPIDCGSTMLSAVWAASPTDGWAVGAITAFPELPAVIRHWGSAADDVWVLGGTIDILRWKGRH